MERGDAGKIEDVDAVLDGHLVITILQTLKLSLLPTWMMVRGSILLTAPVQFMGRLMSRVCPASSRRMERG